MITRMENLFGECFISALKNDGFMDGGYIKIMTAIYAITNSISNTKRDLLKL